MDYEKNIDIPFGAKDSELKGWEYTIPEGFTAEIRGGKVIVREKESEDERIRKELIKQVGYLIPDKEEYDDEGRVLPTYHKRIGRYRAWLENQKEQKSIEDIVKDITKNRESATKFLKSAGIMDDNGELAEMYRSEQKPAEWSDTDKKGLDNCCAIIAMPDIFFDKIIRQKCLDFLYELPERFNLQPKQEWSKEDEKMRIKTTLSLQYLIEEFPNADFINSVKKEKEWLKTLPLILKKRNEDVEKLCSNEWSEEDENNLNKLLQHWDGIPLGLRRWVSGLPEKVGTRPYWKPSEEQMEALNTVLEHEAERVGSSKELEKANALYEQLKKRM